MPIYGFNNRREAETLKQVARERMTSPQRGVRAELPPLAPSGPLRYAILTSALAAAGAGAPLTDATTCTANLLGLSGSGSDLEEGDEITITNRSQDLELPSGTFVSVGSYGFEYGILAADCPPEA
jgi:hypothetical protein